MATSTKQVYDYILKSPENTNGNVLKSFLNDVSGNLDDFIAGKISKITSNLEIIPDFAFAGKKDLETVNLPNAIYIGKYAFSSAPTTQGGSGSDSSEEGSEDEDLVFNNKKLKTVNMDKITHIERNAFNGDENLEITELPDSLLVIGDEAFKDCPKVQLTEFPKNVVYIGKEAFNGENIDLSTLPNGLVYIGNGVISQDKMDEYLQQFVDDGVLITSSVVPHGLFALGSISDDQDSIFKNFTIDGIYIPEDISTIGEWLYKNKCSNIEEINIPNNIVIISGAAFRDCNALTSLTIPNSVTNIGDYAFYNCVNLTSLTIPNSVTSIGHDAFGDCEALTSLTIPNSVTNIGGYAFYNCEALTSLTIPNSVTNISNNVFSDCHALTSLTIPNSVTNIGNYAFANCHALTSLEIPNSVTSIGDDAFCSCKALTSLTIPNSVTNIGGYAFYNCEALTILDLTSYTTNDQIPQIESNTFSGHPNNLQIKFSSQEILNSFASATNWSALSQYFVVVSE